MDNGRARAVTIGRVGGIAVELHWSVLVILALLVEMLAGSVLPASAPGRSTTAYVLTAVLVGVAFLATLFAHELSHALVARAQGLRVPRISLWLLGGMTSLGDEPTTWRAALRMALAGPLVSLGCAVVLAAAIVGGGALGASSLVLAGLGWLAVTNLVLAVFNLLPGAPLDGGRVLQALLWRRGHDRYRATMAASRAGRVLGYSLIGLGAFEVLATGVLISGLWLGLVGWFLLSAASAEASAATSERLLTGVTAAEAMRSDVVWTRTDQPAAEAATAALTGAGDYAAVAGPDGELVGVAPVARLAFLGARARSSRVADATVPLPPSRRLRRDDELLPAIREAGGNAVFAVVDAGRLVGIVSPASVSRLLLRRSVPPPGARLRL